MDLVNMLVGPIVALIIAAVVLMVVSRFNLGLKVDGFGSAIIAALVIAVIGGIVVWLLMSPLGITVGAEGSIGNSFLAGLVYLLVAAGVLLLAGRWLKGLHVAGYGGAIIGAVAIGIVYWLVDWLIGRFM